MDALSAFIFDHESLVRVTAFVGGVLLFGGFESSVPAKLNQMCHTPLWRLAWSRGGKPKIIDSNAF